MTADFINLVQGRARGYKIVEDGEFLAFLSETPMRRGHCLVIPKEKTDSIFDIENEKLGRFMVFAKETGRLIKRAVPCAKIGFMAAGIQVRHAHLHLVPIDRPEDLDFSKQRPADESELRMLQQMILNDLTNSAKASL